MKIVSDFFWGDNTRLIRGVSRNTGSSNIHTVERRDIRPHDRGWFIGFRNYRGTR
jgi:hypothetical protein